MKQNSKRYDVIAVGELNVDLILDKINSFPEIGKEKFADQMTLSLGSSTAIFASNLGSLGARVAFMGKIGMDLYGNFIIKALEDNHVDTQMIIRSRELSTGVTVGFNYKEDRAMVTYAGAMEQFSFADINLDLLDEARHLHFSSYFFQPALQKNVAELFRIAKEKGLTTSFDIQSDPKEKWDIDLNSILPYVDIFLPNERELLYITHKNSVTDAIEVLKDLARLLVVKLGNKGSLLVHEGKTIHQPALLHDEVVDTIGAGDSFDAGFIYKFIEQAPAEICQLFGNLTGAISTRAPGGTGAFNNIKNTIADARKFFRYTEPDLKGQA